MLWQAGDWMFIMHGDGDSEFSADATAQLDTVVPEERLGGVQARE